MKGKKGREERARRLRLDDPMPNPGSGKARRLKRSRGYTAISLEELTISEPAQSSRRSRLSRYSDVEKQMGGLLGGPQRSFKSKLLLIAAYFMPAQLNHRAGPSKTSDVEDQLDSSDDEPQRFLRSRMLLIVAWFILNLALTSSNKAVLGRANYPWLLTTLHTASTAFGCIFMYGFEKFDLTKLGVQENLTLLAFSVLFTLNISISNVSLAMVSVPFHQIMRSTCPVVTIAIYIIGYDRTYSTQTYLTMIPLILGVALATAGDYSCTVLGFWLTLLGVVLASIKTVTTNEIMTGSLALPPMEILLRMSPLATFQCFICAYVTGEVHNAFEALDHSYPVATSSICAVFANGFMAFALNVVSLQTNKAAGALTMTVCGNVKQVLTIGLGLILFNVQVGLVNAVGIVVTIVGAAWYSKVELDGKNADR